MNFKFRLNIGLTVGIWMISSLLQGCDHFNNPYQEDVHYYFETIRKVHPDPYAYISRIQHDLHWKTKDKFFV